MIYSGATNNDQEGNPLVEQDRNQQAAQLFCDALQNNYQGYDVSFNLGVLLQEGQIGVTDTILSLVNQPGSGLKFKKDQRKQISAQFYCIASQKDCKQALFNLGVMLDKEEIVVTDAILQLVKKSESGPKLNKDQPKKIAVQLYCIAAQKGFEQAFFNLGLMLDNGEIDVTDAIFKPF